MATPTTLKLQSIGGDRLPTFHSGSSNANNSPKSVGCMTTDQLNNSRLDQTEPFRIPSTRCSTHREGTVHTTMAETRLESMTFPGQPWFNDFTGSHGYTRSSSIHSAESADEFDMVNSSNIFASRAQGSHIAPSTSWPSVSYMAHPYPSSSVYAQPPLPWQSWSVPSTPGETNNPIGQMNSSTSAIIDPNDPFAADYPHYQPVFPIESEGSDSVSVSTRTLSSTPSPAPSVEIYQETHKPGPIRPQRRNHRDSQSSSRSNSHSSRDGPLTDGQKKKADFVRDLGACWRCRRYKKSCDGPGDCTNCTKGMFRVWPTTLGCRRGCLEDLVVRLLPAEAAEILGPAARMSKIKQPNWRFGMVDVDQQRRLIEERLHRANKWDRLLLKAQSTGLFGIELEELLKVLVKYQDAQNRPNALLEASVQLLDATCDIYHNFVFCAWPSPAVEITGAIATAQRASASVCKMFLTSALSGRRRDWFPSFMSMSISFVAVLILTDAAIAVPRHARELLWGSVPEVSRDLRARLLPTVTDLLRASSNGNKPFNLNCWTVTTAGSRSAGKDALAAESEPVRNPEGMRMLGSDKAAFDGMRGMQEWIRRNDDLIELGAKVLRSEPFTSPEVPCIAPVLKLFDL